MQKIGFLILFSLLLITSGSYAATQEDLNDANNPNDSSYPASNQRGAIPNEPDPVYGKSSNTYTLPSQLSPTSGTTSNPNAAKASPLRVSPNPQ